MQENELISQNTKAWRFQSVMSFVLSLGTTLAGIAYIPTDLWIKAFLGMGVLFSVGSAFTLSKTVRDDYEAKKINNRIKNAKTEKMLKEYED